MWHFLTTLAITHADWGVDYEIISPPFIISFFDFNGPLSGISIESFVNFSMSPEDFFQFENLPVTFGYYYCVLVDIIDDDVIENTEEFDFSVVAQNENDAVGDIGSMNASVSVSILDNDGTLASTTVY